MGLSGWSRAAARFAWPLFGFALAIQMPPPRGSPLNAAPRSASRAGEEARAAVAALRDEYLRTEVLAELRASPERADGGAAAEESSSAGCIREICRELEPLACSTDVALLRIARICGGNYSGACVRVACGWLGANACLRVDDVMPIAAACRADFGAACLSEACRSLGPDECSSRSVVMRVIEACRGNFDARCLAAVCARSASHCGTLDEVVRAGRACGGE